MKKKVNGFTLIELIVTLVVLSIITLMAANIILSRINKTRTEAFLDKVKIYMKGLDNDVMDNKEYDEYKVYYFPDYKIKSVDEQPDAGFAIKNEENEYRAQIWNDKLEKCAVKGFSDSDFKISNTIKTKDLCATSIASGRYIIGQSIYDLFGVEMKDEDDKDVVIKDSCYTVNSDGLITDYDTDKCGTIFVTPNKVGDTNVVGFDSAFTTNIADKEITDVYVSDVPNFTTFPSGFLYNTPSIKNITVSNVDNLTQIPPGFMAGDRDLDNVVISKNKNLTNIAQGVFYYDPSNRGTIRNIELSDLPKLSVMSANIAYVDFEKMTLKRIGNSEGTQIKDSTFYYDRGINGELIIEDNEGLYFGQTGATSCFYGDNYNSTMSRISIQNNKKLDLLAYSFMQGVNFNDAEIIIQNNDGLTDIKSSAFMGIGTIKKLIVKNNKNLTQIAENAFSGNSSRYETYLGFNNAEVLVENNDSLAMITNGGFQNLKGTVSKFSISNNKNLTAFTNSAMIASGNSNRLHINKFIIKNNAKFSLIENSAFTGFKVDTMILENLPSLTSLCRYGGFGNNEFDVLDLSKLPLTTIETSCSIYNNTINTLILPTTLTTFTPAHLTSGVKVAVYAGGSNKCALNNYFVNYNQDGSIASYNINQALVPVCN